MNQDAPNSIVEVPIFQYSQEGFQEDFWGHFGVDFWEDFRNSIESPPRDDNYDAVHGFTMTEWHRAAAKVSVQTEVDCLTWA